MPTFKYFDIQRDRLERVLMELGYDAVVKVSRSEKFAAPFSLEDISITAYKGIVICEKTQRSIAVEGGPVANYVTVRIACSERAVYNKDFSYEVEEYTQKRQFTSTSIYSVALPIVFEGDNVIVYEVVYNEWKYFIISDLVK